MDLNFSENTIKDSGTKMTAEQEIAFNNWWNMWYKSSNSLEVKEAAREAWLAALEYQENKANREFRWDGVIR